MLPYVVKEGDYLEKIAHALGFDPTAVWGDPANADLAKLRDPNLLHPGDILQVPVADPVALPLRAGTTNKYVAQIPKTKIRLVFNGLDGPLANEPYVILGLGPPKEGTTDGDGKVEVDVPVHVREFQVSFPKKGVVHPVRIGDMDPITEPAGVRKRLQHLGYGPAPEDEGTGNLEAADRLALLAFQHAQDIPATGVIDDATRAALTKAHDT